MLLPFAAGYYLSYLFRTINALISAQPASDLALGGADLGLLTSAYFLTFAAPQLPIGVFLDRYGPRWVQSALLLVAAAGAMLFGAAEHAWRAGRGHGNGTSEFLPSFMTWRGLFALLAAATAACSASSLRLGPRHRYQQNRFLTA